MTNSLEHPVVSDAPRRTTLITHRLSRECRQMWPLGVELTPGTVRQRIQIQRNSFGIIFCSWSDSIIYVKKIECYERCVNASVQRTMVAVLMVGYWCSSPVTRRKRGGRKMWVPHAYVSPTPKHDRHPFYVFGSASRRANHQPRFVPGSDKIKTNRWHLRSWLIDSDPYNVLG